MWDITLEMGSGAKMWGQEEGTGKLKKENTGAAKGNKNKKNNQI